MVQMLPGFLCLIGTRTSAADRLFIAWFGPRGLATTVFAVLVLGEKLPGNDRSYFRPAGPRCQRHCPCVTANPLVKRMTGRARQS